MDQAVCFLGDSIGKGVIYDEKRSKYSIVKDSFVNLMADKLSVSVRNLSKFGSTVSDGISRFSKNIGELEACQMVMLEFGGNDCDFVWSEVSAEPDAEHEPKVNIRDFVQLYRLLINKIKASGKTPVLFNLPPVDHKKYFSWISRGLNASNILKWLGGSSEFIYRWHELYNNAIYKIAQSENVKLIDVRSVFLTQRDYTRYLCQDGIHPNEQGHNLIADAAIKALQTT